MRLPKEPVGNTCPDINRIQKTINEIINNFDSFKEEDNVEDLLDSMKDTSWELKDIYSTLEELRSANSALRDWGYELTSLAEEMENEKDAEIEELSNTISEKDRKIESLEEVVDDLEYKIKELEDELV